MKPPIYKTERFVLRPYEQTDIEAFIEIAVDAASVEFMGGSTGDEAAERKLFQSIFNLYAKEGKDRWFWIWGVYESEKLVGHFELKETEHTIPEELEIVYMVHPRERRRGVMSEVLSFAKSQQGEWKRKIIATVNPLNKNSLALLNRWGIENQEILKNEETGKEYLRLQLE